MIIYEAINKLNNKRYIGQTIHDLNKRKRQHLESSKRDVTISHHFYRALNKYGESNFEWKIIDFAETIEELNFKESFWIDFFDTTNVHKGYNLKGGGSQPFLTEEVKRKIGNAQRGELNHMYGKTGELNKTSKPVINLNTNEIFPSVSDLSRVHPDLSVSKVCSVCRGDRTSYKGMHFRYLDSNGNIISNGVKSKIIILKNIDTNEVFYKKSHAFHKYKRKNQDKSNFYLKMKTNTKFVWNDYNWELKEYVIE